MSMKLSFSYIEDYYFKQTVSKGDTIKKDLKQYYNTHNAFPESLKILYDKSQPPQYNIGVVKYHFWYYKTDTSYRLHFSFFEGTVFQNLGVYNVWTFYD